MWDRRRPLGSFLPVARALAVVVAAVLLLREEDTPPDGDALTRGDGDRAAFPPRTASDGEGPPGPRLAGAPGASVPRPRTDAQVGRAAIRGVVRDPDGEARHSSIVELSRWVPRTTPPRGEVFPVWKWVGTRRTGGAGRFAFEGLEPGTYRAEAPAPPGLLAVRQPLELGGEDAEITLQLLRAVAARVEVVTETGQPVEGARVTLFPRRAANTLGSAVTGAEGTATLEGVDPRWKCRLVVSPPRSLEMDLFDAVRAPWMPGDERVVLERAYGVAGRVVDEQGNPVARAVVANLKAGDGNKWALHRTADDGTFRIGRLRPGPVTLRVGLPGTQFPALSTSVTVEAGRDDLLLTVSRGATLTVAITNWPIETFVAGGLGAIVLTPVGRPREAREFRIESDATAQATGLEEGVDYVLWGRLRGLPGHYLHATGVRASEEPLEVRIEKGGSLSGHARCPDGVEPVRAFLLGPGVCMGGTSTFVEGVFRIRGVPPGLWTLRVLGTSTGSSIGDSWRDVWWAKCPASAGDEVEVTLERFGVR